MDFQSANAFVIHRQPVDSWSAFIDYWTKTYNYLDDNLDYDEFVVKRDSAFVFDKDNLRKLFEWKNKTGDRLTVKKEGTINYLIDKLPNINHLRNQWDDKVFRVHFGKISAVWQTYLMHIIQPNCFPIFDQHVYRAFAYLQTGKSQELQWLNTTKKKLTIYHQYQPFFDGVKQESGYSSREVDKALWAFGRYIKQYKQ